MEFLVFLAKFDFIFRINYNYQNLTKMSFAHRVLTLVTTLLFLEGNPAEGKLRLPMGAIWYHNQLSRLPARKERREFLHRLRRRVSRAKKNLIPRLFSRMSQHEDTGTMRSNLERLDTTSPLMHSINSYLILIHYKCQMASITFKDVIIATRIDNKHFRLWDYEFDGEIDIGELQLCVPPTTEIMFALRDLTLFLYGGINAFTVGDVMDYQREHPLVDITFTRFDYWAQYRCKPGCWCDDCLSKTAQCQACLDDGCEKCNLG